MNFVNLWLGSVIGFPLIRASGIPIFPANINTCITPFALRLVKKQWKLALSGEYASQCTGAFTRIHGLPCCHELRTQLNLNPKLCLDPDDFHEHWWFERPSGKGPAFRLPSPPAAIANAIMEPNVVRARGRPRAEDRRHTTRRDPSLWEIPVTRGPRPDGSIGLDSSTGPDGSTGPRASNRPRGRARARGSSARNGRGGRQTVRLFHAMEICANAATRKWRML